MYGVGIDPTLYRLHDNDLDTVAIESGEGLGAFLVFHYLEAEDIAVVLGSPPDVGRDEYRSDVVEPSSVHLGSRSRGVREASRDFSLAARSSPAAFVGCLCQLDGRSERGRACCSSSSARATSLVASSWRSCSPNIDDQERQNRPASSN